MRRYEKYKDSGIEWIGEIPEHWEIKKIKHLTKLIGGYAFKSEFFSLEGIPVIRIGDISDNINFELCNKIISEDISIEFFLNQYDTLIALSGATVGKACYINKTPPKAYVNQRVAKIPFQNKFLFYIITSSYIQKQIILTSLGSAQENISNSQIENLDIALTNISSEQTAIATYLDQKTAEIDALITDKKRLLELYEEEKSAIINEAVTKGLASTRLASTSSATRGGVKMKDSGIEWMGEIPAHWEVKRLRHLLSEKLMYGANESAEEENVDDPRYIRITDFRNDGVLKNDTFKSLPYEKAKDYILKEGDILFARSGATVGKTFQFKNFLGLACFAGYLIKASPNPDLLLSDYLYFFTKSGIYEDWKNSIFNQATIQNIGADKYANLEIPTPPTITEQIQITEFISNELQRIDTKKEKTQKLIDLLTEYRTALISEVVTGKVKVV